MHKLPVILETGAGPNFSREDQLTPFQKFQATPVTMTTRIHEANYEPLHIISCLKLYVLVGRLTKLLTIIVCERLAVPAILGYYICDQMV